MKIVSPEPKLEPKVFEPLPLGQVRPTGWLRRQLELQAGGLSGHLDEFWPDIKDSAWIGGEAEGWERGPYWLDGVVPLAFLLDSAALREKVRRWVDYILAHQHDDGWLGPLLKDREGRPQYDPWPQFIVLKALTQYAEATEDARVAPAMTRALGKIRSLIAEQPIVSWGKYRTADLILSIHWLFERTGESWLLELAETVHQQGFDWRAHFADFPHTRKTDGLEACVGYSTSTHGPNNAMGLKQPGVWYRQSHDPADREAVYEMLEKLDAYHGQANGMFSCDEHLAGTMPSQGTELCAVVETMFSLEVLVSTLGDTELADRLERIAFNALPATFKPDMWAHQYDQQTNGVVCKLSEARVYTDNGPDANLYGLEPHFGCCTANMHQGWPKFAAHLWMKSQDGGLSALSYAPCTVTTEVEGVPVRLEVRTDYPFKGEVEITVRANHPVVFPLDLRIPGWAESARVSIDGADGAATSGGFHRLERMWRSSVIHLHLPMPLRVERRYNGSVTLSRGPLVFGLKIGEDWRHLRGDPPHADWEVYPTTAWNYALELDTARPMGSTQIDHLAVHHPFSPDGAPVRLTVKGKQLPGWGLENNAAAPPPKSPVTSTEPLEELTLIPYGCTNLRVTEFPLLGDEGD